MAATDWLAPLRARLSPNPAHDAPHWPMARLDAAELARARAELAPQLRPAAVLIALLERDEGPTVLLTLRSARLSRHAGQVSFPGGRLDHGDADAAAAAMREAQEETGLDPTLLEPLGYLPDHVVFSGYRITPWVVRVRAPQRAVWRADRAEVEAIFEVPLAHCADERNYRRSTRTMRGLELEVYELQYQEHRIWGATASILHTLCVAGPQRS